MITRFVLIALIAAVFFNQAFSMQADSTSKKEPEKKDTGRKYHFWEDKDDDSEDYEYWSKFRFWEPAKDAEKMAVIELFYGGSKPFYHEDAFKGKLANLGALEARIGYVEYTPSSKSDDVRRFESNYLYVLNHTEEILNVKAGTDEITSKIWTVGVGWSDGYGWKFGEHSDLTLYHTMGWNWNRLNFKDNFNDSSDKAALDLFGDNVRFGDMFEGGIKLRPFKNITLNAGYQRNMIFPRHMFWYWCLSEFIIEDAAQGILDEFIEVAYNSSPNLAPVLSFVLKNALSYGIYELRKNNMNWPIQTAPPIMFDTWKMGISFNF